MRSLTVKGATMQGILNSRLELKMKAHEGVVGKVEAGSANIVVAMKSLADEILYYPSC